MGKGMNWISDRRLNGDFRTVLKFPIFPWKVRNKVVWLERRWLRQTYVQPKHRYDRRSGWKDDQWLDAEPLSKLWR